MQIGMLCLKLLHGMLAAPTVRSVWRAGQGSACALQSLTKLRCGCPSSRCPIVVACVAAEGCCQSWLQNSPATTVTPSLHGVGASSLISSATAELVLLVMLAGTTCCTAAYNPNRLMLSVSNC